MYKRQTCGDGYVKMGAEECDDGNNDPNDNCDNACKLTNWGEDFEGGMVLPPEWIKSGNQNWFGSMVMPHGGAFTGECGNIADNQSSTIEVNLNFTAAGSVNFWFRTSTESGWDFLRFYIDGVQQPGNWSGNIAWTQVNFPVAMGAHNLRWRYVKDDSVSSGADTVWVDDITTVNAKLP